MKVKAPPHNGSHEAIALRVAAQQFTNGRPSADAEDLGGQRRNQALLAAAVAYAHQMSATERAVFLRSAKGAIPCVRGYVGIECRCGACEQDKRMRGGVK